MPSNAPDEMRKARSRRFNDILEWLASEFGFQVMCLFCITHIYCCYDDLLAHVVFSYGDYNREGVWRIRGSTSYCFLLMLILETELMKNMMG